MFLIQLHNKYLFNHFLSNINNLQTLNLIIRQEHNMPDYNIKTYYNVGLITNLKVIYTNSNILGVHLLHYVERIIIEKKNLTLDNKIEKKFINEVVKLLEVNKKVRVVFNFRKSYLKNKIWTKVDKYFAAIKSNRY